MRASRHLRVARRCGPRTGWPGSHDPARRVGRTGRRGAGRRSASAPPCAPADGQRSQPWLRRGGAGRGGKGSESGARQEGPGRREPARQGFGGRSGAPGQEEGGAGAARAGRGGCWGGGAGSVEREPPGPWRGSSLSRRWRRREQALSLHANRWTPGAAYVEHQPFVSNRHIISADIQSAEPTYNLMSNIGRLCRTARHTGGGGDYLVVGSASAAAAAAGEFSARCCAT